MISKDDDFDDDFWNNIHELFRRRRRNMKPRQFLGFHSGSNQIYIPTDFPNLKFWHDISQLTGLTDGSQIPTLTDFSGNGLSMTQATPGRRGIYKTNILNGLPILRTDGSLVMYQSTVKTDWDWMHNGDTTLIFIFYPKTDAVVGCLFDSGGASLANVGRVTELQSTARLRDICAAGNAGGNVFSALPLNNTLPKNQWHISVHRYKQGDPTAEDFTLKFDDTLVAAVTGTLTPSASTSTTNPTFFSRSNQTNNINCDYAWGAGYNRALTDAELANLIGSTISNYGL